MCVCVCVCVCVCMWDREEVRCATRGRLERWAATSVSEWRTSLKGASRLARGLAKQGNYSTDKNKEISRGEQP